MKKRSYVTLVLVLLSFTLFSPLFAHADIEWSLKKQLNLEAVAKDVALSPDGKWLFVLAPGEILVYSLPDYKVANRIPVDKIFDHLAQSGVNNTLIVSSSTDKTLKVIELNVTHQFSLDGLAFKGVERAPVTLVVFSDYQ